MRRACTVLLMFIGVTSGEFNKVGTTVAAFLKMGVGARAAGMGGGYVALADDGSAHYWNPAGLSSLKNVTTSFNHNRWALDIRHEFASVAVPSKGHGTYGFSLAVLRMGEQEVTTVREPEGTGLTYSVMDMAFGASYAMQVSDRLSYGFTLKYIQLSAYNERARTFAFDVGSILRTNFYGMKIGMALSNFGGEMRYQGRDLIAKSDFDEAIEGDFPASVNLNTEAWPLPLLIRIGVALDVMGSNNAVLSNPSSRFTLALDADHPNDGPEHLNLGGEYAFRELVFLRAGYRVNYDEENITFGAGVRVNLGSLGETVVDYAIKPLGPFGNTSQISIEIQF